MAKPENIPKVFIIILNWNGWEDTNECLASLMKLNYPNYRILVVDNASTDDSVDNIRQAFSEVQVLQMSENNGYAAGNNEGIRYALAHGADYMWILNNDTVVDSHALDALVEKMETNSQIGMCGSLLKDYDHRERIQTLGGLKYYKWFGVTKPLVPKTKAPDTFEVEKIEEAIDFVSGAAMFVSRAFVKSTGLMSEQYFLYFEEIDWVTRSRQTYGLGFVPESIVYHKEHATVNADRKPNHIRSKLAEYYQKRSRLKFTHTHYPQYLPVIYLTIIYASAKRLFKGRIARAVMIFKLMFTYNR